MNTVTILKVTIDIQDMRSVQDEVLEVVEIDEIFESDPTEEDFLRGDDRFQELLQAVCDCHDFETFEEAAISLVKDLKQGDYTDFTVLDGTDEVKYWDVELIRRPVHANKKKPGLMYT